MNTKRCYTCKQEKDIEHFSANSSRKDGLQGSCKVCMTAYKAAHYKANKDKVITGNKDRTQKVKDQLWEYKQGKSCADCGNTNPMVFEFDHLGDKEFGVSNMVGNGYSWARVLTEIAKCEIVCANCHRIRTATRAGWVRNITITMDRPEYPY